MRTGNSWKLWAGGVCWILLVSPWAAAQQPKTASSSARNRTSLAITLYNSNFALVRETRDVNLPAGTVRLAFQDVPSSIEASTVHVEPEPGVEVLDQSYEYDLLSPDRLLEKYVGKPMTLIFRERVNGTTRDKDVNATLLSTQGPVWKIGDQIVTGIRPDGYRFPELPGGLYSRPTLVWTLRNERPGARRLSVSYLANQMNWTADYVLNLTREGTRGSLEGWVTLANSSGANFQNAKLLLVAGQVHRATSGPQPFPVMAARAQAVGGLAQQFSQQPVSEYHLYTLGRPVDLRNHETKQISLLSAASVPVTKTYVFEGNSGMFRMAMPIERPTPQGVQVILSFKNDKAAGLGEPLPAGVVRVYQPDAAGNPILLGEDRISHTPKDETTRLHIGSAFDVVATRKQTDFRRIGQNVYESAFEITLRNHKATPVTVEVREPVNGSWQVLESNFPAKKLNAFTLGFDVPVPSGGEAKLTYRVRVTD